jgi:hypothetical protein
MWSENLECPPEQLVYISEVIDSIISTGSYDRDYIFAKVCKDVKTNTVYTVYFVCQIFNKLDKFNSKLKYSNIAQNLIGGQSVNYELFEPLVLFIFNHTLGGCIDELKFLDFGIMKLYQINESSVNSSSNESIDYGMKFYQYLDTHS